MASGFGARGSEGRCAPLWREFARVRGRRDARRGERTRRARTNRIESIDRGETTDGASRRWAQCVNDADDRSACFKFREDYVECLHHRKEYTRENAVAAERRRRNDEKLEGLVHEMRTMSWVKDPKYAPKE